MALDPRIKKVAVDYTKELMVAKLSNSVITMEEKTGKNVALFMREIYNEFVELLEDTYESE
ncbi:hypothetical protein [Lacrimispora indolis]|uniref:hypothetical protein n=1 Tax=Lacrimispora indolis TaxID=69825 RepID=UPI00045E965A|nr:hypothetical protein [Lacrimispora indolis]